MKKANKVLSLAIKTVTALSAVCLVSFSTQAKLMTGHFAEAWASSMTCPSYCTDFEYNSDGGEMETSAYASIDNGTGYAQALANLTGSSYLPILKVEASAAYGKSGSAEAYGLQRYTYSGNSTTTIELNLNLHGSSMQGSENNSNYIRSQIAIFMGEEMDYYRSFESLMEVGTEFADYASMRIRNEIDANVPDTLMFEVNPGDSFFVVASMRAKARDGYSDAWNTLSMNFTNATGLVASSAPAEVTPKPIPEPSSILLFCLAILGFGVKRANKA